MPRGYLQRQLRLRLSRCLGNEKERLGIRVRRCTDGLDLRHCSPFIPILLWLLMRIGGGLGVARELSDDFLTVLLILLFW